MPTKAATAEPKKKKKRALSAAQLVARIKRDTEALAKKAAPKPKKAASKPKSAT
ncbi:MAG: hypothetical protein ACRYFV_01565 [Janthinobacterium lividum]